VLAAVVLAVAAVLLAVPAVVLALVVAEVSPAVMVVTVAIKDKVPCKDKVPWANQLRDTRTNSRTNINTETITVSTRRLNRIMAPVTAAATMVKALKTVPAMVRIRPDSC